MKSTNTYVQEQEVEFEFARDSNSDRYIPHRISQEKKGINFIRSSMIAEKNLPSLFTQVNRRPAFTTAGDYETVIRLPKPIYSYHKTLPGTVDRYRGKLREIFPELAKLTKEDFEKISRKRDITE